MAIQLAIGNVVAFDYCKSNINRHGRAIIGPAPKPETTRRSGTIAKIEDWGILVETEKGPRNFRFDSMASAIEVIS